MIVIFNYYYYSITQMNLNNILSQLEKDLGIPKDVIYKIYSSSWDFIKQTIKSIPIKEENFEQYMKNNKVHFSIPYLGKLSCNYNKVKHVKNNINDKHKED